MLLTYWLFTHITHKGRIKCRAAEQNCGWIFFFGWLQKGQKGAECWNFHVMMGGSLVLGARVEPHGEVMHSPFSWRRNPTKTLGFLLPWFSPWFFVGFLLSPPPYAQSFPRKPSVLVLADFFSLVFEIQATAWFSWSSFACWNKNQLEILLLYEYYQNWI